MLSNLLQIAVLHFMYEVFIRKYAFVFCDLAGRMFVKMINYCVQWLDHYVCLCVCFCLPCQGNFRTFEIVIHIKFFVSRFIFNRGCLLFKGRSLVFEM